MRGHLGRALQAAVLVGQAQQLRTQALQLRAQRGRVAGARRVARRGQLLAQRLRLHCARHHVLKEAIFDVL